MDKRVNTLAKLGYRMCVVPKAAEKSLGTSDKMKIVGCRNLKEVINTVFTEQWKEVELVKNDSVLSISCKIPLISQNYVNN